MRHLRLLLCSLALLALFAPTVRAQDPELRTPPAPVEEAPQGVRNKWHPDDVATLLAIYNDIQLAKQKLSDAEAALLAVCTETKAARDALGKAEAAFIALSFAGPLQWLDPDPPVDPDPDPDPDPTDPDAPFEGHEFTGLPFNAPAIPNYRIPTIDDCDWIIEDDAKKTAVSTHGLPAIDKYNNNIAAAYRASIKAGHTLPITFGIWGNGGRVHVGGLYNANSDHSLTVTNPDGSYQSLSVEFVGLDDSCEIMLGWATKYGYPDYIGAYNIGLRGPNDSFIIRANEGVDKIVIDGCWWLPNVGFGPGGMHASGIHVDNWHTFVWRNHQFRGVLPSDPGTLFREHSAYLKSCIDNDGGTWIVGNNLLNGGRTGFQIRPQRLSSDGTLEDARPQGVVVVAYNTSDGYGDHGDGGGAITVWSNPDNDTYVFGNKITDAFFQCLVVSPQAPDRDFTNANGFPIKSLYLYDNEFENERSRRGCASITGVETVHLFWDNTFDGSPNADLALDSSWAMHAVQGPANGEVRIYGRQNVDYIKTLNVKTWDPNNSNGGLPVPKATLESYFVPMPPPGG